MLRFDAEKHEYWLGDKRLPSVSEIIAPAVDLSAIPEDVLERKSKIGRAVHLACQFIDQDGDVANVHPSIAGYVDAWRLFKSQIETDFVAIEQPMNNDHFAGTPDRICKKLGTVDIKTVTSLSPATALQTAGYAILSDQISNSRFAVQLKPDGKYVLQRYSDRDDFTTFRALVNFYHWRKKHE